MTLKERIVADLTAGMKSQDAGRTGTLRMVKAHLMNRQIDKGSELTDEDVQKALQSLVKQRRDSVEQYEKAGRPELAAKEASEIEVIAGYLPQAATREEIDAAVEAAISSTGAASVKDMGTVMKVAQGNLVGKSADGKTVSDVVRARLSER